ncbi:squalene/phytoene synthase family protein [Galbibacter sp. EGI 63066]|uniref:phytoene/squalene synthase family protein n=1 Tax=Galbibacter sp. EGI 63066 TaxID=2993559 RepID=UPI00224878CC|nr:squalene/phytoene synthase family protein [Galbibacter sp. EGI 63066]MCX2679838.1 squalene/phytoene synthase family protein [Galbibacter sp. EGI 63066]
MLYATDNNARAFFQNVSSKCSKVVTESYSTSFSIAIQMLDRSVRGDIYNIYAFARLADEIVDTFSNNDHRQTLFNSFYNDLEKAIENKVSTNPILNAFQYTFHNNKLSINWVRGYMNSMQMDLGEIRSLTPDEFEKYIYGSVKCIGLMCLKVFVKNDKEKFESLRNSTLSMWSAFQKVNFLRDIGEDFQNLNRTYFPNINYLSLGEKEKQIIVEDIEIDFNNAAPGIRLLPKEARFGVYMAYIYYKELLKKIKRTPVETIKSKRVRISNCTKVKLLCRSYLKHNFFGKTI